MSLSREPFKLEVPLAQYVPRGATLTGHCTGIDDWMQGIADRVTQNEADIAQIQTAIVELRFAAQGAMTLATPVAGPDITAAFQPITFFDTIPYEQGVTVDTATGQFEFNVEGDWALFYRMNLAVSSSGTRRTLSVRSFNVTAGTPGPISDLFIGSNAPDVADTLMVPLAIGSVVVGPPKQSFRIEIGNASNNITGVTWNSSNLLILFVGELGSLAP